MINWFDVPSESPNKDLTLKNLKVSENGTYGESGVAYSSVEVNVNSGGGGSSDFSTAELVCTNDAGSKCRVIVPLYADGEDYTGAAGFDEVPVVGNTFEVILYKNKAVAIIPDQGYDFGETTGSVERLGYRTLQITGSGTVKIVSAHD